MLYTASYVNVHDMYTRVLYDWAHVMSTNKMAALEEKLTINEEYAKRYEQKKRAEELSKREATTFRVVFPSFQSH